MFNYELYLNNIGICHSLNCPPLNTFRIYWTSKAYYTYNEFSLFTFNKYFFYIIIKLNCIIIFIYHSISKIFKFYTRLSMGGRVYWQAFRLCHSTRYALGIIYSFIFLLFIIIFIWVGHLGHYLLYLLRTLPRSELKDSCLINGLSRVFNFLWNTKEKTLLVVSRWTETLEAFWC